MVEFTINKGYVDLCASQRELVSRMSSQEEALKEVKADLNSKIDKVEQDQNRKIERQDIGNKVLLVLVLAAIFSQRKK
jgi:hypothetical protein